MVDLPGGKALVFLLSGRIRLELACSLPGEPGTSSGCSWGPLDDILSAEFGPEAGDLECGLETLIAGPSGLSAVEFAALGLSGLAVGLDGACSGWV